MHVPAVFAMPEARRIRLELSPRLESWNRSDHPDQVRLRAFVAHVRKLIDPVANGIETPLAFRLDVGLDDSIDPLWERDLNNYLFPIARGLPPRYVSVWGTKGRARHSFVTVGPADAVTPPAWPSHRVPRTLGSEGAWKIAVRDAVADRELIPPGPVAVQVSLSVGPRRSWSALWKRTIDGRDALLGRTYPDREWNPQDGRIVRLGLHVRTDEALGHDVEATVWARAADMQWPELRWLASMDETERAAYLAAHQAIVYRTATTRTRSGALRPRAPSGSAQPGRRGRRPTPLAVGLTGLTTEEEFDAAIAGGDLMLKTDTAGPPKIHTRPAQCAGITKENFRASVIIGGGRNAGYFTRPDPAIARRRWPRVVVCGACRRLDPTGASAVEAAISANENPHGPTVGDVAP
jgi:hypothetical protein